MHKRVQILSILPLAAGGVAYWLLGRMVLRGLPFSLSLQFKYLVPPLMGAAFGPLAGALAGGLGEILLGLSGSVIWWSVVLGAVATGFIVGVFFGGGGVARRGLYPKDVGRFALACLLAQGAAWVIICPALDLLLYREAFTNLLLRGAFQAAGGWAVAFFCGVLPLLMVGAVAGHRKAAIIEAEALPILPDGAIFDDIDRFIE